MNKNKITHGLRLFEGRRGGHRGSGAGRQGERGHRGEGVGWRLGARVKLGARGWVFVQGCACGLDG